jgi:hypothetical protein
MVKPYIKVRVSTLVHGQALHQGQGTLVKMNVE